MISIRLEAFVRLLDDLDAAAYALRVFWQGNPARSLMWSALLAATLAGGLFMSTAAAG